MDAPIFFPLSQLARPPALDPRHRSIDPAIARALDSWFRNALRLPADTSVELSEWVSVDSRAVPHRVCVLVGTGRASRRFVIEKASERIVLADVHAALRSQGLRAQGLRAQGLRAHARDTAPA